MEALQDSFTTKAHRPSPQMWMALASILSTLETMANGAAAPDIYVGSLDPGVGKTQAVIAFLKALLASNDHADVAAIVCVGRLTQIEEIIRDAGLSAQSYAVFTADTNVELNSLGCGNPSQARVLITTHAMVESRCNGRAFADMPEFHYRGCPRTVRIWDEAILPGRTLTFSRDDIASLLKPMRRLNAQLGNSLDALCMALLTAENNTQHVMPDLEHDCGVDLYTALQAVKDRPEDRAAVEGLWFLFGKVVTVRRDGKYGNTILDYRETLPPDIAPLLVLDASARVRATYKLWEDYRGGVVPLPTAPKDYSPLTINMWSKSGGKGAFKKNSDHLITGIANTIDTKPDEAWLVVHHKGAGFDVERDVMRLIKKPRTGRIQFINWGRHDATNDYADIPNIILAGTLFYRPSYYEALARLSTKPPPPSGRNALSAWA
jgi:hypothetical protein